MANAADFPRVASLGGPEGLRRRLAELNLELPVDDEVLAAPHSPLAEPLELGEMCGAPRSAANRFVIQPMEGWDGTTDGKPTELTVRRWRNFGRSGAAWIWGGEAAAIHPDGRANPNQLVIAESTAASIGRLREELLDAARVACPGAAAPIVGLQLTHSGRWSRPHGSPAPRIAYRHPLLDRRVGVQDDTAVIPSAEVNDLVRRFAEAAYLARELGFDFVDVKHCHGYLLHEFLSARGRTIGHGGPTLAERTRLTEEIIAAVRAAAPGLGIAVRLSIFDTLPHRPDGLTEEGRLGPGVPESHTEPYLCGFGVDPDHPDRSDLGEPLVFLRQLHALGVRLVNVTAGSPYYVPHIQRPAAFPPSDGYAPPEDPLVGVVRLLDAAREAKRALPELVVVSSGWSYLQDFLPHVAQACVREGWFDAVGLGRVVLSYPDLPADVLNGRPLQRKKICRTFSDCTTAPRNGMVSGCYPLDEFYRVRPERQRVEEIKRRRGT